MDGAPCRPDGRGSATRRRGQSGDLRTERGGQARQREPDGVGQAASEAEPQSAEPDERALGDLAAKDFDESQDLVDRELVRRSRPDRIRAGPGRNPFQGQDHEAARRRAEGRVDDDARLSGRDVEQVVDTELPAMTDVRHIEDRLRQASDGRLPDSVIAAVGLTADEDADRVGRAGGHGIWSTRISRKWVAHEMHGS